MNEVEAINYMENEIKCIKRASRCDRDCARCELVKEEEPLLNSFGVAIRALERRIAKKPTVDEFDYGNGYVCGFCESFLHYVDDDDEHIRTNYCCHCGQKIDWS